MYYKLALRNICRGIKGYTIYFITLVFVVSIVYLFNSIESQNAMMDIGIFRTNLIKVVSYNISTISVFIPYILGFLVIYTNHYLIKKRKKEFGIYLTLGMSRRGISAILFTEVLIVGIVSLLIGLIFGVLLSQGLSFITASLMNAHVIQFKCILSKAAFYQTIYCFSLIFVVVLIFNSLSMMRIKVIDLISVKVRIREIKSKRKSILIIVLGLIVLIYTYYNMLNISVINKPWSKLQILMIIGTILFYYGIAAFLQSFIKRRSKFYLKDLNMVVFRNINSNININLISIIIISLILYITVSIFSIGIEISRGLDNDTVDLKQFDLVLWDKSGINIQETLKSRGFDMDKDSKEHIEYNYYKNDFKYKDFFGDRWGESNRNESLLLEFKNDIFTGDDIPVISKSDFNKIMKIIGKENISLKEGQYAIYSDIERIQPLIHDVLKEDKRIVVNGKSLEPSKMDAINVTTYDANLKINKCTIIVDDSVVEGLSKDTSFLIIESKDNVVAGYGAVYQSILTPLRAGTLELNAFSTLDVELINPVIKTALLYMTLYICIILLILCATILGLQQLTETVNSKERYKYLKDIGVDEKMINKAVLIKICAYFFVPLVMAIINLICSMQLNLDTYLLGGNVDIFSDLLIILILYGAINGGYILITYKSVKQIIDKK